MYGAESDCNICRKIKKVMITRKNNISKRYLLAYFFRGNFQMYCSQIYPVVGETLGFLEKNVVLQVKS